MPDIPLPVFPRGVSCPLRHGRANGTKTARLVELVKIDLWYRWRPATGETVATQSCSSQTDPTAEKPFPRRPRLCDVQKATIVKRFTYGKSVGSVTWSPDGKAVAACGGDQPLRAWEVESGREIAPLTAANVAASAVFWCSDGKRLFAWGPTGLKTLDSQTGKVLQELPGYGSGRSVRAPSMSADGRLVAFSYWDRSLIRLFRLTDGKMLGTVLPMVGGGDVFISPAGHYRGPAGVEKKLVYIVETDAGQETLTPEEFSKRHGWKNDPAKVP